MRQSDLPLYDWSRRPVQYARYGIGTRDVQDFWPAKTHQKDYCKTCRADILAGSIRIVQYGGYHEPTYSICLTCAETMNEIVFGVTERIGELPGY